MNISLDLSPSGTSMNIAAVMQSLTERRRQCESLIRIMQQWKNIQISYSKKMSDLSESINKLSFQKRRSRSKQVLENLWYLTNIIAIQSKNLVLKINDDIITQAKQTIKSISTDLTQPLAVQKNRKKSLAAKKKIVEQTCAVMVEKKKVLEDLYINKFIVEQCVNSSLDKRMKVNKKVLEESAQYDLIEFKMKDNINQYNSQLNQWELEAVQIKNSVKELESSYGKVVFDIYTKSQLHRGAEYKTILHEIDRVLEKSAGLSECNESVLGEQPEREKESICCQRLEMSDFDSFLLKTVKMIDSKAIQELTVYSKNKDIKEAIKGSKGEQKSQITKEEGTEGKQENQGQTLRKRSESEIANPVKYYENLSKFYTDCLQGEPTQDQILKFQKLLNYDQRRRIDFISIFQRYRIQGKCHMKSSKRRAKKILDIFLDTCLKLKDGFCCRSMMVLLFTYYFIKRDQMEGKGELGSSLLQIGKDLSFQVAQDFSQQSSRQSTKEFQVGKDITEDQIVGSPPNNIQPPEVKPQPKLFRPAKQSQKIYLQILVQNHPIWKRLDYWQSVLIECIYQEMLGHRRGSRGFINQNLTQTSQQQAQTLRNIVFSQLLAMTCNMKLLGCSQKQISAFITKFSKLFGLTNQRIKEIQKSLIASTLGPSASVDLQELLRQ